MGESLKLTHLDEKGRAVMVDVSEKASTRRTAWACGRIEMNAVAFESITDANNKKGDVLTVAQIAGIMAAKKVPELIPLCHSLALSKVEVECHLEPEKRAVLVRSMARCQGPTGVEMEALTATSVACLTLFDMIKALDPEATIQSLWVERKQGGKSGDWSHSKTIS